MYILVPSRTIDKRGRGWKRKRNMFRLGGAGLLLTDTSVYHISLAFPQIFIILPPP